MKLLLYAVLFVVIALIFAWLLGQATHVFSGIQAQVHP